MLYITKTKPLSRWVVVTLMAGISAPSFASGYSIFTQSAYSLGQGNAAYAVNENPSAVYFNPALITKLDGTQVELGTTLIDINYEFASQQGGANNESERSRFFPSTFYLTHQINDKLSAGFGLYTPFGLGTEWDDEWEGRYITTTTDLTTVDLTAVLAYQVAPGVAMAAGIDYLYLDASIENKINLSAFGVPDANQTFGGTGSALGFNLGLSLDVNKDIAFGLSYHSGFKVDLDGDAEFDFVAGTPAAVSDNFPDTQAESKIDLPQKLHAGLAYSGLEDVSLQAGVTWEGWHS